MTDAEIIKALEYCNGFESCPDDCPYYSKEFKKKLNCLDEKDGIMAKSLDLINRQKAEIEELQSELIITKNNFENAKERYDEAVKISQKMNEKLIDAYKKLQTAKSEAYKEFAERLKAYFNDGRDVMYLQTFIHYGIDRLIKELSEVSDNA